MKLVLDGTSAMTQDLWRKEVAENRHNGSLDSLYEMELAESFKITGIKDFAQQQIPGLQAILTREQLTLEGKISRNLNRPDAADSYAQLLESEYAQYAKFLADVTERNTASEEEIIYAEGGTEMPCRGSLRRTGLHCLIRNESGVPLKPFKFGGRRSEFQPSL